MRKTNFSFRLLQWAVLPMLLTLFCSSTINAQAYCAMACNDNVQVSLDGNCEALITYDMMLEDPWNPAICSPNGAQAFQVIVMDWDGNVVPTSPYVTCDYIGQTLPVKVKHWATGNECWGHISIEDKIDPVLSCPPVTIWCNEPYSPADVGYPGVTDNCDNWPSASDCGVITLTYSDVWIDFGCVPNDGYSAKIERTWVATDASGNSTSCVQDIWFQRATFTDLDIPPHYDGLPGNQPAFDCASAAAQALDAGQNAFNYTGYPSMHGIYVDVAGGFCEINVTWEDTRIDICDGSFKILRDWRLVDWCTGEILEYTQIIKVLDENTDIACPAPWTVGTNGGPTSCTWSGNLPAATVNEDCSSYSVVTEVFIKVPIPPYGLGYQYELFATINGNGGAIAGLPLGESKVVYHLHDDCGNHDTCETYVTVEDDDAPTVVCDEWTQITMDPDCSAIVYAETFDDGSHDNCCDDDELTFEVRRQGTPYGDYVSFGPADVMQEIMVFMRVTDCNGNTSEDCMVMVLVDDKTDPIITCPPDKTIECWTDYNDLALTGEATATDACSTPTITWTNVQVSLNPCGVGFVRRRFTATDAKGNSASCQQRINIVDSTPLTVNFPPDYTAQCTTAGGGGFQGDLDPEDLPAPFNGPVIGGDDCELVAVNHFDAYFPISDNACFKIIRQWVIIDWCIFDANGPQTVANGYYSSNQEIKVMDNEDPEVDCPDDYTVCIVETDCDTDVVIENPGADDCAPDDYLTWSVFGDFNATKATGDFSDFTFADVEPGTYNVTLRVDDGCNNKTMCPITITVVDCKKPTPYCVEGLVIEIMQTGMVDIWSIDFDAGSFDNCPGDLQISFSSDVNDTQRIYTCDDIGQNDIEMWVTDAAGNQDYCATFVVVQDNMDACDGGDDPLIAGVTATEDIFGNNGVQDVNIEINGDLSSNTVMTAADGAFNLNVPAGDDYTVTPTMNADPLNGVTTFDLVVMRKHILGTEFLQTPYQLIAADINSSESISTFDMVELRKVILQINSSFPNNSSWRFVDSKYEFPQPANPWFEEFPEVVSINNVTQDELSTDFVAVKIGDLNGNAATNGLLGGADDRTSGTLVINTDDVNLAKGQQHTVNFTSDDFNALGYQFTLNFSDALEFVEVVSGVASEENFGLTMLTEGAITTSWNGEATNDVLFSLTFQANQEVALSDVLNISSRVTTAEAYDQEGNLLDVELQFNGTTVATGFELFQNTPNPFRGETLIGFNLPEAGNATMTIQDVSGKVILVVEGDYAKGYNQVAVSDLPATGVLYYTLETANDTATRKMIMIK